MMLRLGFADRSSVPPPQLRQERIDLRVRDTKSRSQHGQEVILIDPTSGVSRLQKKLPHPLGSDLRVRLAHDAGLLR